MGISTFQLRSISILTVAIIMLFLVASCTRAAREKILGEWINVSFAAQTMSISKSGETYVVEIKNSQMPELNQKFAARYKDGVIYLQGTQTQLFYDEKADRISGVFGLGRNEFKRK